MHNNTTDITQAHAIFEFTSFYMYNCYKHFLIPALFVALADQISLNIIFPRSIRNTFLDANCFTKSKLSFIPLKIQIYIHGPHFQNLTSEYTSIKTCFNNCKQDHIVGCWWWVGTLFNWFTLTIVSRIVYGEKYCTT